MLVISGVAKDKSNALELRGRATCYSFSRVAILCAKQGIVEHCRDIPATCFLWSNCLIVFVCKRFEIASDDSVERVRTYETVYVVFKVVPCASSGVEAALYLRSDVGIIENLMVCCHRMVSVGGTNHMTSGVTWPFPILRAGYFRVSLVVIVSSLTGIHLVARACYPNRAEMFAAVAD